jgi:putative membrane protein
MSAFLAFLHHLAAFVLVAALSIELVLLSGDLTAATARKLQRVDMVMGISAGILLVVGLLRVFHFEKGWDYYSHSAAFLAKFALFVIVALISIYPTVKFISWAKEVKAGRVPVLDPATRRSLRIALHLELTGVVLILLCAALMARGIGHFG